MSRLRHLAVGLECLWWLHLSSGFQASNIFGTQHMRSQSGRSSWGNFLVVLELFLALLWPWHPSPQWHASFGGSASTNIQDYLWIFWPLCSLHTAPRLCPNFKTITGSYVIGILWKFHQRSRNWQIWDIVLLQGKSSGDSSISFYDTFVCLGIPSLRWAFPTFQCR